MTDIPIIFSGPMVRALLSGRKTMTRRLAWRAPGPNHHFPAPSLPTPWQRVEAGDRLWVRESLKYVTSDPVTAEPTSVHCYAADIPPGMDSANPYEASYLFAGDGEPNLKPHSIPSIHMPRWASRLTLIVTAIKVERLQDISEADATAEGADPIIDHGTGSAPYLHRIGFEHLWCRLHGDMAWIENPEVVALSFKVNKANIDTPESLAA